MDFDDEPDSHHHAQLTSGIDSMTAWLLALLSYFFGFVSGRRRAGKERQPAVGSWRQLIPSTSSASSRSRPEARAAGEASDPEALDRALELAVLAYTRGSERYENIYKAVWQNFSYMAALAAGILTFGAQALDPEYILVLAVSPLFIWYLATFRPMDVYGDGARKSMVELESQLNKDYLDNTTLNFRLQHYTNFVSQSRGEGQGPAAGGRSKPTRWRVATAVHVFGGIVCALWIIGVVLALQALITSDSGGEPPIFKAKSVEIRAAATAERGSDFVASLRAALDSVARGTADATQLRMLVDSLGRQVTRLDSIMRVRAQAAQPQAATPRP